jgi:hypothetical protein
MSLRARRLAGLHVDTSRRGNHNSDYNESPRSTIPRERLFRAISTDSVDSRTAELYEPLTPLTPLTPGARQLSSSPSSHLLSRAPSAVSSAGPDALSYNAKKGNAMRRQQKLTRALIIAAAKDAFADVLQWTGITLIVLFMIVLGDFAQLGSGDLSDDTIAALSNVRVMTHFQWAILPMIISILYVS